MENIIKKIIVFAIIWFLVGFISMILVWIKDMRGEKFDEEYFSMDIVVSSLTCILMGFITPFIAFSLLSKFKKRFTKIIYLIANIGVK